MRGDDLDLDLDYPTDMSLSYEDQHGRHEHTFRDVESEAELAERVSEAMSDGG